MSTVCKGDTTIPIDELIEQIDIEVFDYHLKAILDQKDCACKNTE